MNICGEPRGPGPVFDPCDRWPLSLRALLLSAAAHVAAFFLLGHLPSGLLFSSRPDARLADVRIVLPPAPVKIYWVPLKKTIPKLAPGETTPVDNTPAGRKMTPESIVVKQPDPASRKQFVWQPDMPARKETKTPLPNMVAVKGNPAPDPAPPVEPPPVRKPKPRDFVPPQPVAPTPAAPRIIAEAPSLPAHASSALTASPSLATAAALPSAKAPPKSFTPPPARAAAPAPRVDAAPELPDPAGTGAQITATVIDMRPLPANPIPRPDGARAGEFSTGPRRGAPAAAPGTGGVQIPGVAAQGRELSPAPSVPGPGISPPPNRYELRIPVSAGALSAPLRPASRVVPRVVDERFPDRVVYAVLVQKPDLPEYSGDWTIWFAERGPAPATGGHIRAPYPVRKLLGPARPPASASGGRGSVQMTAVIDELGRVGKITVLPGRYSQLAARAVTDLASWEFRPANRNGISVGVEVIIEIPFRIE